MVYLNRESERVVLVFLSANVIVVASPFTSVNTTLSAKNVLLFKVMEMFL